PWRRSRWSGCGRHSPASPTGTASCYCSSRRAIATGRSPRRRALRKRASARCWRGPSAPSARHIRRIPMHLDDERTQRWLHAELDDPARQEVAAHLVTCAECQAQVAAAEAEEGWIRARLADIPDPRAVSSPAGLRARAIALRRWQWAATILLSCAAAGTAYAMPGSPVPRWVERVAGWISRRDDAPPL